jgi:hypothetical protein
MNLVPMPMRILTAGLCVAAAIALTPLWVPLLLAAWCADLVSRPARWLEVVLRGRRRAAAAIVVLIVVCVLAPTSGLAAALVPGIRRGPCPIGRASRAAMAPTRGPQSARSQGRRRALRSRSLYLSPPSIRSSSTVIASTCGFERTCRFREKRWLDSRMLSERRDEGSSWREVVRRWSKARSPRSPRLGSASRGRCSSAH